MKAFNSVKKWIIEYKDQIARDRVGIYSGQASFFIVLSIFPFILLLISIVSATPVTKITILHFIDNYIPAILKSTISSIVNDLYAARHAAAITITAILALWSASKGIMSIMQGLYKINNVNQKINYFFNRFLSLVYTFFFVLVIATTMVLAVFGNMLFKLIANNFPNIRNLSVYKSSFRYLLLFIILTIFFMLFFRFGNLKHSKFKYVWPGALFTTAGWMIFSWLFGLYVTHSKSLNIFYGSMSTFIILMLWIYACIAILFLGEELNVKIYPHKRVGNYISKNK
ncbi:MAG: YihY/virulence factor BrkB family protein [Eubacterium sp.]|nr:YihY/virulence factor BrkB family protein [Eubacterium sp.]